MIGLSRAQELQKEPGPQRACKGFGKGDIRHDLEAQLIYIYIISPKGGSFPFIDLGCKLYRLDMNCCPDLWLVGNLCIDGNSSEQRLCLSLRLNSLQDQLVRQRQAGQLGSTSPSMSAKEGDPSIEM